MLEAAEIKADVKKRRQQLVDVEFYWRLREGAADVNTSVDNC